MIRIKWNSKDDYIAYEIFHMLTLKLIYYKDDAGNLFELDLTSKEVYMLNSDNRTWEYFRIAYDYELNNK